MANQAWDDFLIAARGGEPPRTAVALGISSGFVPHAFKINTLDYFMYPDRWLNANLTLMARFSDLVMFPGLWVEYGIASEPSAFGTRVLWKAHEPPAVRPLTLPPERWGSLRTPDPHADGLMALVVRRYWKLEHEGSLPEPHRVRLVAARGPCALAASLVGQTAFLEAATNPNTQPYAQALLKITTETAIRFLQAQLSCLREPVGILLLDDVVGMLTPRLFHLLAIPALNRVFDTFDGLIRAYHSDTPHTHLLGYMGELHFDLWHLTQRMDIAQVRAALPDLALMGNLAPAPLMTRGEADEVEIAARVVLEKVGRRGLILSLGDSASPHTPAENIDALIRAARE